MLRNAEATYRPALGGTGKAMEQQRMTHLHDLAALGHARVIDELTKIISHAAAAVVAIDQSKAEWRAKSDLSPVSAADEAANRVIIEGLSGSFLVYRSSRRRTLNVKGLPRRARASRSSIRSTARGNSWRAATNSR